MLILRKRKEREEREEETEEEREEESSRGSTTLQNCPLRAMTDAGEKF